MKNGLYLLSVRALDGAEYASTGMVVVRDGTILGAGAGPHIFYTGSYSFKDGRVKGEIVVNTHTPAPGDQLFFGATDVGVGISGTYEGDEAEWLITALHGKRSISLRGSLRKLADA
jgi:hypothetical protein